MSLAHLRTFIEVYRRRSLTGAARMLGLTQPAVSQQVASLETLLGRPLFERHARGVRPTAVADDLAASLGDRLDQAEAALASVRARSTRLSGTVHLAAPSEYLAERVAGRLKPLVEAGLELRLHVGGKDALYAMLLDDRVHLALTASRLEDRRLAYQRVGTERLVAVAAPAEARRILAKPRLADGLNACPLLAYDLDRPLIRAWLDANGLGPPTQLPVATAPDLRAIRAMLRAGLGWSVLPDYLLRADLRDGVLVEIPAPATTPENAFHLVWVRSALRHPRVAAARDALSRALAVDAD
ncbi:LysR family transcriptional regulator [Paracraurococcus ruber]|uniref:LysR family transcriptional regulator n=1 Tax=Paracraurococcus ruber TaxID=77675 RepID=A0ABS1D115_9PROT|nr:LysR family transcriptional regulator [Paracraurococcus ruber]MBK1660213.1 LysR family transcriptional regulator [Paracraurococcus ruber]TDG25044.1 LysR family transcriptional regulator [Paracraurococcus ruber]